MIRLIEYAIVGALIWLLTACGVVSGPDLGALTQTHMTSAGQHVWTLDNGLSSTNKRILLIHGLTKDHTMFFSNQEYYLTLYLWGHGYQIVFIDLHYTTDPAPYSRLTAILNDSYPAAFYSQVSDALAFADTYWGSAPDVEIGGVSWGGLHTLMACSYIANCDSYFVLIPVPDIAALTGFQNYEIESFRPINEASILSTKHSFISYGGADQAVNSSVTTSLISALAGAPTVIFYPSLPHQVTIEMVAEVTNWLNN